MDNITTQFVEGFAADVHVPKPIATLCISGPFMAAAACAPCCVFLQATMRSKQNKVLQRWQVIPTPQEQEQLHCCVSQQPTLCTVYDKKSNEVSAAPYPISQYRWWRTESLSWLCQFSRPTKPHRAQNDLLNEGTSCQLTMPCSML